MRLLTNGIAGTGVLLAVVAICLALDARGATATIPVAAGVARDTGAESLRREIDCLRNEMRVLRETLADRPAAMAAPDRNFAGEAAEPGGAEPDETRDVLALGQRVIAATATPEESARFWRLARSDGLIDRLIAQLGEKVEGAPRDVEARLELADGFILKLFTVPPGPEMATWGGKACDQWREVLRLEPDHWKARFSIAVSLSYHPDVAGKTPEAIRELEQLVKQQESMTPEPHHADVYRLLATLLGRQGDREAAERILRLGLSRHPDDPKLRKAVEGITK